MSETDNQVLAAATHEEETKNIVPNFDKNNDSKEFKFSFRKDKLGARRPAITLNLPVPSVEGLVDIITKGGKGLELVFEAMSDITRSIALDIINSDETMNADKFPVAKTFWDAIANMPKEDRRSSSIPTEQWEGFAKDYAEVMPGKTGRSVEQVGNAVAVYLKKFSICKTDKTVLKKLQSQLAVYMETTNAENFSDVLEFLNKRLETYLEADDVQAMLQNL